MRNSQLTYKQILKMLQDGDMDSKEAFKLLRKSVDDTGDFETDDIDSEVLCYGSAWEKSEIKIVNPIDDDDTVLVLGSNTDECDIMKKYLKDQNKNIYVVTVKMNNEEFKCLKNDEFEINASKYEDYKKLIKMIKSSGKSVNKILYLNTDKNVQSETNDLLELSIYSLINICKTLMEYRSKEKINLLYAYFGDDSRLLPFHSAVSSFAKTLSLENPNYICNVVQLVNMKIEDSVSIIYNELIESTKEYEIKYENRQRFIKKFFEVDLEQKSDEVQRIKENGVYIITGGLGRLGTVFAMYLAQKYKARLILSGTSSLNENNQKILKKIQQWGTEVIYCVADVSCKQDVLNLVFKCKEKFGHIDGIIHAAGVIHDSFILKKDLEKVEKVIRPKVYGTIYLDEATKDEKLDFFAFFSSLAVLGTIGQADYAYGNNFMDQFSFERNLKVKAKKRSGKTLSINWPLWEEGGMSVDKSVKQEFNKKVGLIPMKSENGLKIFEKAVSSKHSQIFVLEGEKDKINKFFSSSLESIKDEKLQDEQLQVNNELLHKNMEIFLKTLLSKETKIHQNKINVYESLEKYGIDSMMIMNLNRELENEFGNISKTLFFEYQNISDIADYFVNNYKPKVIEQISKNPSVKIEKDQFKESGKKVDKIGEKIPYRRFVDPELNLLSNNKEINEPIAVIGVSGSYPMASNLKEYWENLKIGKDCITEIADERWRHSDYFNPNKDTLGKTYSKWGGFINDVDKFDPLFFNISPMEAEIMDPQERLFLQTVWHAMEDSGYSQKYIDGKSVGVFVGVMYGQYQLYGADRKGDEMSVVPSSSFGSIANRVSYYFNLHGPSIAVDTMCSSSLYAIHLACQSIYSGESEIAIAGGVNLTVHPNKYLLLSQGKFISRDGRCRTFGEGGDGYVPGEGIGAVILKPLSKAIHDRDQIYAVIKGSAVNHGGKTNGYTVPNPNAQSELISNAIKKAGINPKAISYIEAHGTGTSLGDPIEITGLVKALGITDKQVCPIGSVKSNIGHLESAAGIAAFTKVLLQMKYGKLVPSIHSEMLNPNINFSESPFYVQHEYCEWKRPLLEVDGVVKEYPRVAGISAFGAGGSNAHIVLEEYIEQEHDIVTNMQKVFVMSAKNKKQLKKYVEDMIAFLIDSKHGDIGNIMIPSNLIDVLKKDLVKVATNVLGFNEGDIFPEVELEEYGFNVANISKFAEIISDVFNISVDSRMFLSVKTISQLADGLLEEDYSNIIAYYKNENDQYVRNSSKSISMYDIAYTLQVGREAMDERIAAIASSKYELVEKLYKYLNDEFETEGLYVANIKKNHSVLTEIYDGRAGEEFLKLLIDDNELDKIARLWVNGVEIEWQQLYSGIFPCRVSLPTYPFEKERYWITDSMSSTCRFEKLHPLVHNNISTIYEVKYKSSFSGNEFFFTDSILKDRSVLPRLTLLEMAYASGKVSTGKSIKRIKEVKWGGWIKWEGELNDIYINLYPHLNHIQYEISSKNDELSTVYSQGTLSYDIENAEVKEEDLPVDLEALENSLKASEDGESCYELLNNLEMKYKSTFKVIKKIRYEENELLVNINIPASTIQSSKELILHPSLMEGIVQAINTFISIGNTRLTVAYMPYQLEELEIIKPLIDTTYIHLVSLNKNADMSKTEFNARFMDKDGYILGKIKGLILKPFRMETKVSNDENIDKKNTKLVETIQQVRYKLENDLKIKAAELLKITPEKLDVNESLGTFGFESVAITDLTEKISNIFNIKITPVVLYDQSSIRKLSKYLTKEFEEDIRKFYTQSSIEKQQNNIEEYMDDEETLIPFVEKQYTYAQRDNLTKEKEDIAIIGINGIFPGSKDLDEFWENLKAEKNLITEVPIERWDWKDYNSDFVSGKLTTKSKWGGFISDIDKFDPRFFNISPLEAEMMDPQQRVFMEVLWKTIEDSGYKASDLSGKSVGLFVGVQFSDYQNLLASQGELNVQMGLGNEHSILVNRISYLLNLRGPSEPYNTACSSTLVAIHRAIQSIRCGESEMAIAGGINLNLSPFSTISADQMGVLSPDGCCKTYDVSANGYVKGEGVGALILKPLSKAINDHDYIHAVIKGTAVNHGGKASSLMAPNSKAQSELLVKAHEEAGISPDTVTYIEAHGTGTQLGDPIEIEGIKSAFSELAKRYDVNKLDNYYCGVGSVKTNIGHLEPASGIASIIKVILSMKHKTLPGILHLKNLNPYVKLDDTPFFIVKNTQPWNCLKDSEGNLIPRRSGVSSFGFGGVNAHVVLEEYKNIADSIQEEKDSEIIIVLSAKNPERLNEYIKDMLNYISKDKFDKKFSLKDIAYTLQVGREVMNQRIACVVNNRNELIEKLSSYINGETDIKGFYINKVKIKHSEDMEENKESELKFVELVKSMDLDAIARMWINGEYVNWEILYVNSKPNRVSLPTYPFAKERYWAPKPLKDMKKDALIKTEEVSFIENTSENVNELDSGYIGNEIKEILAQMLKLTVEEIEDDINFAEYGVDSLLTTVLVKNIQDRIGQPIRLSAIAEYPTIQELSAYIGTEFGSNSSVSREALPKKRINISLNSNKIPSEIIAINPSGENPKSFWVHGGPGYAAFYNNLSIALGSDYPFYAFQAKGYDGKGIPRDFNDMVSKYIECIRAIQPVGPYFIGGFSSGGLVGYEIARKLEEQGEEIGQLIMLDTMPPTTTALKKLRTWTAKNKDFLILLMANEFTNARKLGKAVITRADLQGVHNVNLIAHVSNLVKERWPQGLVADEIYNYILGSLTLSQYVEMFYERYVPIQNDKIKVLYFKATEGFVRKDNWLGVPRQDVYKDYDYTGAWREIITNDFNIIEVPSDHFDILQRESLEIVTEHVKKVLSK